jgi:hypothetical protein
MNHQLNHATTFPLIGVARFLVQASPVCFYFADPLLCDFPPFTGPLNVKHLVDYNKDLYAYATTIISTLRSERDREREAHRKSVQDAEARIAFLEAKLARREAELEGCILHTPLCLPLPDPVTPIPDRDDSIREQEMVAILNNAFIENRALKVEVKTLADHVSLKHRGHLLPLTRPVAQPIENQGLASRRDVFSPPGYLPPCARGS